jgi:general secretion pathway protein J
VIPGRDRRLVRAVARLQPGGPAPTEAQGLVQREVSGFTLVEMMVALAIMSLIMLATVTALRTLGSTQVSLERVTARNDEIRSVSAFLRDALESAVSGASSGGGLSVGGGLGANTLFEARPTSLTWKTALLLGESTGGSYVVRVALENREVVLRWQRGDSPGELREWNTAPQRTLVTDVDEFAVAYRRGFGGSWEQEWDRRGAPDWVRLRIQAGGRFWPDIIMQVAK